VSVVKIDLDRAQLGAECFRRLDLVCHLLRLTRQAMYVARTTHGWHVALAVSQTLSPAQIVAIQAIAGSDWKREAFTLMRTRRLHRAGPYWSSRWNTLYDSR
jgi:hypothetical protein